METDIQTQTDGQTEKQMESKRQKETKRDRKSDMENYFYNSMMFKQTIALVKVCLQLQHYVETKYINTRQSTVAENNDKLNIRYSVLLIKLYSRTI